MFRNYPGFLSGTQLIWMCDWPKEFLVDQASYYLKKHNFLSTTDTDMMYATFLDLHIHNRHCYMYFIMILYTLCTCRDMVVSSMANIHSFALRDSNQIRWAGETSKEVPFTQIRQMDKKKEQIKIQQLKLSNNPYSKTIMLENIRSFLTCVSSVKYFNIIIKS